MQSRNSLKSPVVRAFCKELRKKDPTRAVECMARAVFKDSGYEIPLCSRTIALKEGIPVLEHDIDCDGILSVSGERFVIQVSKTAPERRQNFTIGHELGHYYLIKRSRLPIEVILTSTTGINEEEQLCNRFAAALLIPECDFTENCRSQSSGWATAERLADRYQVSAEVIAIEAIKKGLWEGIRLTCRKASDRDGESQIEVKQVFDYNWRGFSVRPGEYLPNLKAFNENLSVSLIQWQNRRGQHERYEVKKLRTATQSEFTYIIIKQ